LRWMAFRGCPWPMKRTGSMGPSSSSEFVLTYSIVAPEVTIFSITARRRPRKFAVAALRLQERKSATSQSVFGESLFQGRKHQRGNACGKDDPADPGPGALDLEAPSVQLPNQNISRPSGCPHIGVHRLLYCVSINHYYVLLNLYTVKFITKFSFTFPKTFRSSYAKK